jgi:hypothetical protein
MITIPHCRNVDMIATGKLISVRWIVIGIYRGCKKPQLLRADRKVRGTRTCSLEQLKATGTPSANLQKSIL